MNTTSKLPTLRTSRITKLALPLALGLPLAAGVRVDPDACEKSTQAMLHSCWRQTVSDFWLARANCLNLPTMQEKLACILDAEIELDDAQDECYDQQDARRDLCARLGGGIYHPLIDPDDFVPVVDNQFFPLLPGTTFTYEKLTSEGIERVELIVTSETKEILGVDCTVVHDIETLEGEVQEDTFDWFAQDVWGNVWYFGELSFEYEDGEISGTGGSWKAGEDGAKPGIIMEASPQIGDVYRQEFFLGEAEDAAGVLSLSEAVTVPYGAFTRCLKTEDFTPLEPGNLEHKFYAPGVGLVLEFDPGDGGRLELIAIDFD